LPARSVTGDISVVGNSQIVLGAGVNAKIYFRGNVDIARALAVCSSPRRLRRWPDAARWRRTFG
jgi:hypothetical protein